MTRIRFHEIDLLRGFACLSVIMFHFLSRGPHTNTMPGVDFPLIEAVARYGYLGVHLFFLISGFVILMSATNATPRSFAASRASRLYPALWAAATLTAGTAWLLHDARFMVSGVDYLANLTMAPHWFGATYVDGAYWSLVYELHFYILVWLAIRFGLMDRVEWLLAGWLCISAANLMHPTWAAEFWLNAQWAPFFAAGGLCYLVRLHGLTRWRAALLAASFLLAEVYALQYGPLSSAHAADASASIAAPAVALIVAGMFALFLLIAAGRLRLPASPVVFYAGALTYPMYVIHQHFGFMVYGGLHGLSGNVAGSLAATLALILFLSWGIYAGIERPLGPVLRRWLEGSPAVAPLAAGRL